MNGGLLAPFNQQGFTAALSGELQAYTCDDKDITCAARGSRRHESVRALEGPSPVHSTIAPRPQGRAREREREREREKSSK